MKNNNSSGRNIANNLKFILNLDSYFLSPKLLTDVRREDINAFLNSKIKSLEAGRPWKEMDYNMESLAESFKILLSLAK